MMKIAATAAGAALIKVKVFFNSVKLFLFFTLNEIEIKKKILKPVNKFSLQSKLKTNS